MDSRTRRGFTLIELLVVVAIIALLIAILLPSLAKARQMSLRTRCGASIRGWGLAVNLYQQENSDFFAAKLTYMGGGIIGTQWDQDPVAVGIQLPPTLPGSAVDSLTATSSNVSTGIYSSVGNHVLNAKMRFCPADAGQNIGVSSVFYYGNRPLPSYKFAYYANASGAASASQPPPYWRASSFKDAQNKLLMCDSNSRNNYGDCVTWVFDANATGVLRNLIGASSVAPRSASDTYSSKDEIQDRHGGKGNVLFLSGHVESLPWTEFDKNIPKDPTDTAEYRSWTRLSN